MSIEVRRLTKSLQGIRVLNDVSFTVKPGELVALLGPSGSGKTTLLRLIAGLERPESGEIWIEGQLANDVPPQRRRIGFVFQHYALFPRMTVYENVAFGMKMRRCSAEEIERRVRNLLTMVQLHGLEQRYPHELSGGQQQRVALARALAVEPAVLLLDEPFSAIDAKVRKELRRWVRQVHEETRVTTVFVTHDQEEALGIADRVLVLQAGRVEQFGTPEEVYLHPATPFVASFIGEANTYLESVRGGNVRIGAMQLAVENVSDGQEVCIMINPSDVQLGPPDRTRAATGKVLRWVFRGTHYFVELDIGNALLRAEVSLQDRLRLQEFAELCVEVRQYRILSATGQLLHTHDDIYQALSGTNVRGMGVTH